LWVYTLNYFADLPQTAIAGGDEQPGNEGQARPLSATEAAGLIDFWIDANPPGTKDTWDPYAISIRTVNWIKWMLLLESTGAPEAASSGPGSPSDRILDSLAAQLRLLERRLEFDIAANHLMANAVALAIGGLFFGGDEGDRWANNGFALLFRELREQVRDDGGHYERSPTYHAVVLEQLLDVLNLWTVFPKGVPGKWRDARRRLEGKALAMLEWLDAMTHPDGGTSFFNDATFGAAVTRDDLRDYAERLGLAAARTTSSGVHRLDATGFFRLTSEDGRTIVLFDAGAPQPRYQPGHAHAESLSFELSRDGRRVFVNSASQDTPTPSHSASSCLAMAGGSSSTPACRPTSRGPSVCGSGRPLHTTPCASTRWSRANSGRRTAAAGARECPRWAHAMVGRTRRTLATDFFLAGRGIGARCA
jgi:uncharacterized heparinase superfamily protein